MSYSEASAKIKARAAEQQVKNYYPLQMAFWQEDKRAIANELARCALFQCRDNRKPRQFIDNEELFMLGEGTVTYKGEELRTQDEDIFVTLAHLARDMPSGDMVVRVSSSEICKMNGWRQDQRYYNSIFLSIQRMKGGVISVFSRRIAKALRCQQAAEKGASSEVLAKLYEELNCIDSADVSTKGGGSVAGIMLSLVSGDPLMTGASHLKDKIPQGNLEWEITLDKNLVALFAKPYLTLVDMKTRESLSGTGRRLQAFFSSHRDPYPVKLRSLEKMLGLNFGELKALKFALTEQFNELQRLGVIETFRFEKSADRLDWLVEVTRRGPEVAQSD